LWRDDSQGGAVVCAEEVYTHHDFGRDRGGRGTRMIASIYAPTLWIEFANLEKMRRRGAEGGSVVLMNGRVAERVQPQLEQMGKWAVVALKWAALGNVERPLIWPAKHLRGGGLQNPASAGLQVTPAMPARLHPAPSTCLRSLPGIN
jgi:hypothetical protein